MLGQKQRYYYNMYCQTSATLHNNILDGCLRGGDPGVTPKLGHSVEGLCSLILQRKHFFVVDFDRKNVIWVRIRLRHFNRRPLAQNKFSRMLVRHSVKAVQISLYNGIVNQSMYKEMFFKIMIPKKKYSPCMPVLFRISGYRARDFYFLMMDLKFMAYFLPKRIR